MEENPPKNLSGMLPHYLFLSACTLGVIFSSTTPSKAKNRNSMSLRHGCFDNRVPHLTLVWEPVGLTDPLKHKISRALLGVA